MPPNAPADAGPPPFPASFVTREIAANGVSIHTRIGGKGPAAVLLHGFGETGDMWAPLAAELANDHQVIVPDLRGLGLSTKPAAGFDKKTQAGDVCAPREPPPHPTGRPTITTLSAPSPNSASAAALASASDTAPMRALRSVSQSRS